MAKRPVALRPTVADVLLTAAVVLLCAALCLWAAFSARSTGNRLIVELDGAQYGSYSLTEDQRVDIDGRLTLVIEDARAYVDAAACPDKSCMKMAVDSHGGSIVCLPGRVVIYCEAASSEVDIIAGGG